MVKLSSQNNLSGNSSPNTQVKNTKSVALQINPLDIAKYLLSNWYWFILSILVCGGLQWYKYNTTQCTYSASASVMFRDAATQARQAGLDRLAAAATSVNVSNEILQFHSPQLMRSAIQRLHADISYEVKDFMRVKELYTESPITVSFTDSVSPLAVSLVATPMDDSKVLLSNFSVGTADNLLVKYGQTVRTPIGELRVDKSLFFNANCFDEAITVKKMNLDQLANSITEHLFITQASADGVEDFGGNASSVLNLSLDDVSAQRAKDLLNTLIIIYNEQDREDKNEAAKNTYNFINERLQQIEEELSGVEESIQNYKQENNIVDVSTATSTSVNNKEQYTSAARDLEMQAEMGRYIKGYLVDPKKANDLLPANTGLSDAGIEAQISAWNTAKLKRDRLLEGSSEANPVVQDLNNQLVSMRQSIIRAVDNMNMNIQTKLRNVSGQAGQAASQVSAIPRISRHMLSIERQQNIKQELYLYLLNKREESQLSTASTETNARVVQAANGSDEPVSPIEKTMVLKGVLLGFAVPAAILLFIMFFDTRVKTRRDIEGIVSIPFLGVIPQQNVAGRRHERNELVVLGDSRDMVSEAFRIVRTNMDFMGGREKEIKVVTFSSFGAGAGKTFVSRNLAASFAQAKKKVVMVDLDIRKGTLSSRSNFRHEVGMTSFLSGKATLEDIIRHDPVCDGLDIIPAGPVAPNPAELLLSSDLDLMIDHLREHYDIVFVDNVPYGAVADAAITNRVADLTIFVIRAGRLDRRMLPELEQIYQEGRIKNMSLILNGASSSSQGGYGYGYEDDAPWKRVLRAVKRAFKRDGKKHHHRSKY